MDTTTVDQIADAVIKRISGGLTNARYMRVECWLDADPSAEPIWAEVRCNLPFATLDAIPLKDVSYAELWTRIAPWVRAWNCVQEVIVDGKATGEYAPVPPPAEGGVDVFRYVDPAISDWLALAIKRAPFGGPDRPKVSPLPSATGSGLSGPASEVSKPATSPNDPTT